MSIADWIIYNHPYITHPRTFQQYCHNLQDIFPHFATNYIQIKEILPQNVTE
jgi:hypothetical protein